MFLLEVLGFFQLGIGGFVISLFAQCGAQVFVKIRIARIESNRLIVLGDRLPGLALIAQGLAKIGVGRSVIGIKVDCIVELGDRSLGLGPVTQQPNATDRKLLQ